MMDSAREVRTNSEVTFSHGLLNIFTSVLVDYQKLTYICTMQTVSAVYKTLDDRDGWQEIVREHRIVSTT